ncbi:2Fe-2S iron-sulfur cluster-binding protein [Tropicibacter alexandrii]|jgi:ring-1,2-phenylacetyl-CoA epoxidase subunit PaaE|uniref:2Fe-2S iron-sulfur cluster-binding protein n=1 Tax=Tropicibacter alexandrii TaxID=2267683 RepID=UPI000EF4FD14|nr:2Fe-2S iron-sulfur cluster-binding protein [Tropicibacter alexandrii]
MFHQLTISEVRPEGDGAVAVSFDVPETAREAFAFAPGQYLTLRADVDGADLRRSYSIATAPGRGLTVGIKRVEGGVFSTFAQSLKVGDAIQVMPPEGRFTCKGEGRVVLVAAGSGVTPMVAIAAERLAAGAEVTLVYGNRNSGSIMFREALEQLKDRYLERFTLIHVLSREPQDVDLLNGRVSGAKLLELAKAGAIDLAGAEGVFLCGPGEMIEDVAQALEGLVPPERVHFERFYTEDGPRPARSAAAEKAAEAGVQVEVVLDGARRSFAFEAQDDNVVDAAARAGLELPYSCKGGMCCTCRCKVAGGAAEMAVNYSLEPWELEAGFILACQARPVSDSLVLDFDES